MSGRLVRDTVTEMHRAESRWLDDARGRLSRNPATAGAEREQEDER